MSRTIEHHALLEDGDAFSYTMDVEKLISLSMQIYEELLEKSPGRPNGVCVTGQMHGIVYVDAEGKAVSPLYTWMDMRGNQPRTEKESYAQYYGRLSGYPLKPGYGVLTHIYNVRNGLVPENMEKLCTIMDFLTMRLCGEKTPLIDPSAAMSLGIFDMKTNGFDLHALTRIRRDFLELDGGKENAWALELERFPEIKETGSFLGHTKEGLLVLNSIGDNQAGTYWAIQLREDVIFLNIGTSGQVSALSSCLTEDVPADLELRPYVDGRYLFVGAMLNGGNVYQKLKDFFSEILVVFGSEPKVDLYTKMNKILEENPPEEDGIQAETCLLGMRSDPNKTGNITGITLSNFNVTSFLNAFAEGILKEGYEMYLQIPESIRKKHKEIAVAGNLLRRSKPFCLRAQKRFGLYVKEMGMAEEAAAGAARLVADQLKRK